MKIEMDQTMPAASAAQIQQFHRKFGVLLPEDYIDFLIEYGGGTPIRTEFDDEPEFSIVEFYSLNLSEKRNLWNETQRSRQQLDHQRKIPFAFLQGGNRLFFDVSNPQGVSKVYYWDHEDADSEFHYVCDSFSEMVGRLNEEE